MLGRIFLNISKGSKSWDFFSAPVTILHSIHIYVRKLLNMILTSSDGFISQAAIRPSLLHEWEWLEWTPTICLRG